MFRIIITILVGGLFLSGIAQDVDGGTQVESMEGRFYLMIGASSFDIENLNTRLIGKGYTAFSDNFQRT
jgi:hypothetical protein